MLCKATVTISEYIQCYQFNIWLSNMTSFWDLRWNFHRYLMKFWIWDEILDFISGRQNKIKYNTWHCISHVSFGLMTSKYSYLKKCTTSKNVQSQKLGISLFQIYFRFAVSHLFWPAKLTRVHTYYVSTFPF
jgi:hypothetical protein